VYLSLYSMYVTMSISIGLYPNLDLWNANKLHYSVFFTIYSSFTFANFKTSGDGQSLRSKHS